MLTISFIPDTEIWKSTAARQEYLLEHQFLDCKCTRCIGPDYARAMRCPACSKKILRHSQPHIFWLCESCSQELNDSDMPMHAESLMSEYITTLFQQENYENVDLQALLRHCHSTLGAFHFLSINVVYLILVQFWNTDPASARPLLPKRLAANLAESLADWFIELLPRSMPTAQMCRFAAAILAAYGGPDHIEAMTRLDAIAQSVLRLLSVDSSETLVDAEVDPSQLKSDTDSTVT